MEREQQEKRDEEDFRQKMLEKFAEDDRIEQMNAQKRRMKQADHRREVERLIEARRAEFEAQKAAELVEGGDGGVLAEAKRQIIEEERKRMLAAHAQNLGLEHLPKGQSTAGSQQKPDPLQYASGSLRRHGNAASHSASLRACR